MKTKCKGCKYRHDFYKKVLNNNEAWCLKSFKFVKDKKNCIHFRELSS